MVVLPVLQVNLRFDIVNVLNRLGILVNVRLAALQIFLKRLQLIRRDDVDHAGDHCHDAESFLRFIRIHDLLHGSHHRFHHGGDVKARGRHFHRVLRHRILLQGIDVIVDPGGHRQNQRDGDNADCSRKPREQRTSPLGDQVVCGKADRSRQRHGRKAHVLMHGFLQLGIVHDKRIGIVNDTAVLQPDDPCGILLRQIRVVRHHDDHPVFRHLF